MFFWHFFAFSMIWWMLMIWSLIPLPVLNPAWTYGISWCTYHWSLAWRILSIILLACEMTAIVWQLEHSLTLPFFGIGIKTPFPVLWPGKVLLTFPNLLSYWVQHLNRSFCMINIILHIINIKQNIQSFQFEMICLYASEFSLQLVISLELGTHLFSSAASSLWLSQFCRQSGLNK